MSVFGVFLVRIFPHSNWIRRDWNRTGNGEILRYLRMQTECVKIRTRKTPGMDNFHAVIVLRMFYRLQRFKKLNYGASNRSIVQRFSVKKVLLNISPNSQENTCVFSFEFWKLFKNSFKNTGISGLLLLNFEKI